jgi:hypothetical protein
MQLLPEIRSRYLGVDQALERLHNGIGLVPVAIDPRGSGLLYFADIGQHPFQEWKFIYTIKHLLEQGEISDYFVTDLELLDRTDLPDDGIKPFALLLHVSRCGSTLLTKSVARLPENLCINQGGPLQEGFWSVLTHDFKHRPLLNQDNINRLRRLVLLLTRHRDVAYQRAFIKFISWNIIYLDLIRAAFPTAAVLYLYRDPAEVIANIMQETTAVLRARGKQQSYWLTGLQPTQTAGMDDVEYLASCYAHYYALAASQAQQTGMVLLNYQNLKQPGLLMDIMARGLGLHLATDELKRMSEQYRYHSKDDSGNTVFIDDTPLRLRALDNAQLDQIHAICAAPLQALDEHRSNLYPSSSSGALKVSQRAFNDISLRG